MAVLTIRGISHGCSIFMSVAAAFAMLGACGSDDGGGGPSISADAGNDAARADDASGAIVCAQHSGAEGTCFAVCPADQVCFTQVVCGRLSGGGRVCSGEKDGPGDDLCHRSCENDEQCGPGESCARYSFYGCGDYNGERGICCPAGGCL